MGQIQSIHSSPRRTTDDQHRFRAVGLALPGKASKLIYGPIIFSPLQQWLRAWLPKINVFEQVVTVKIFLEDVIWALTKKCFG